MFLIIGAKRVKTENKQGVLVYQGRVTFSVFVMRAGFTEKVALNRNLKEVEGWTSISGRKKKKRNLIMILSTIIEKCISRIIKMKREGIYSNTCMKCLKA